MNRSMPGLPVHTNSWSSPRLTSIKSVMPSSHLILCRPLLLPAPIPPSIRVFSNESTLCTRWPKYWSFGFSISPSNEHPGLISFRMDWLDLLAVQGTLKSLKYLVCHQFIFPFTTNPHIHTYSELIFFRMDWLDLLASKGLARVFSNTTVLKHQFFCAQLSSQSNSHIRTWLLKNHSLD